MFHVCAHLKEADLKAGVESNLFTRCTLAFHPKASGRHTGSSLGLEIYGNSVADINLKTSCVKFLQNFVSTHPVNSWRWRAGNTIQSPPCIDQTQPRVAPHNSPSASKTLLEFQNWMCPRATLITLGWHSPELQCAEDNASRGASQRIIWLSLH